MARTDFVVDGRLVTGQLDDAYRVITADSSPTLESYVNAYIRAGWSAIGGPGRSDGKWFQGVAR